MWVFTCFFLNNFHVIELPNDEFGSMRSQRSQGEPFSLESNSHVDSFADTTMLPAECKRLRPFERRYIK